MEEKSAPQFQDGGMCKDVRKGMKGQRRLQLYELQFILIPFYFLKQGKPDINLAKYWHLWNPGTHLFVLLFCMLFLYSIMMSSIFLGMIARFISLELMVDEGGGVRWKVGRHQR